MVVVPKFARIFCPAVNVFPAVKPTIPTVVEAKKYEGVAFEPFTCTFTPRNEASKRHLTCRSVPAKGITKYGEYAPVEEAVQTVVVAEARTNECVGEIRPVHAFVVSRPTILPVEST